VIEDDDLHTLIFVAGLNLFDILYTTVQLISYHPVTVIFLILYMK